MQWKDFRTSDNVYHACMDKQVKDSHDRDDPAMGALRSCQDEVQGLRDRYVKGLYNPIPDNATTQSLADIQVSDTEKSIGDRKFDYKYAVWSDMRAKLEKGETLTEGQPGDSYERDVAARVFGAKGRSILGLLMDNGRKVSPDDGFDVRIKEFKQVLDLRHEVNPANLSPSTRAMRFGVSIPTDK